MKNYEMRQNLRPPPIKAEVERELIDIMHGVKREGRQMNQQDLRKMKLTSLANLKGWSSTRGKTVEQLADMVWSVPLVRERLREVFIGEESHDGQAQHGKSGGMKTRLEQERERLSQMIKTAAQLSNLKAKEISNM